VCFKTSTGQTSCELLDRPRQTIRAPVCGAMSFANADGRGYYFTEYGPDAVRELARGAARLAPIERLSLVGDEWWMVRAGRHDIGVYLDLAGGLASDETTAVIDTLATRLAFTADYLVEPLVEPRWQSWIRARFGPSLDALGVPGDPRDSDERQSRRAELLGLVAGTGNDPALQRRIRELADGYLSDPASLAGTLAPVVLRLAATSGDAGLYDRYLARLDTLAAQPEEYSRFFNALSWFGQPALVQRTLAFAISPAVRTQDTGTLLAGLLSRPASRDAAWAFVQMQWPSLTQKLGTFQGIPTIVGALGGFCSSARASEVRQFFEQHPVPSAARTLRQAIERIENCTALRERQSPALASWLQSFR